jgi:hypothetical protein
MENLNKLKLKELENLYWSRVEQGYILNPELNFRGFKGRITKERWIWSIENQIKKTLVVSK